MQFDSDFIATIAGVASSLVATALGWGVLKTKVTRLERDIEQMMSKFVSTDLFNAIISGMKEDLHEMKGDMKKVLQAINK